MSLIKISTVTFLFDWPVMSQPQAAPVWTIRNTRFSLVYVLWFEEKKRFWFLKIKSVFIHWVCQRLTERLWHVTLFKWTCISRVFHYSQHFTVLATITHSHTHSYTQQDFNMQLGSARGARNWTSNSLITRWPALPAELQLPQIIKALVQSKVRWWSTGSPQDWIVWRVRSGQEKFPIRVIDLRDKLRPIGGTSPRPTEDPKCDTGSASKHLR